MSQVFDEAPDYVDWLVPDLLTSNELYCLAAPPRRGKSLLALALAKAISSGGKFLDRPCQKGNVVYIGREDPDDKIKQRMVAQEWERGEMDNVLFNNKILGLNCNTDRWSYRSQSIIMFNQSPDKIQFIPIY